MQTINIFISSPGDVQHERIVAKRVINKLAKEFASVAAIRPLIWEDMPLSPSLSFQEGIDAVINTVHVDIAVFIIWSRLGSPLNDSFKKKDGSPYASGTEYEFDVMMAAYEKSGSPYILAYVKTNPTKSILETLSENDLEEFIQQKKAAKQFISERFYDKGTNTERAHFQFDKTITFENQLTTHLRELINRKVGENDIKAEWKGNPYVGLRSFKYEESPIFFGRNRVVNDIMYRLTQAHLDGSSPTLFVLGKSGCGKSSLVRAGLFPDICDYGLIPNSYWKRYDIHPGKFGGSFYNGLCDIVMEIFPGLANDPCGEDLEKGLPPDYDSRHLRSRLSLLPIFPKAEDNTIPLIFIDQFEELFSNPQFPASEIDKVLKLLRVLSESRRIWMLFSMRNDFYVEFSEHEDLQAIKDDAIVYDVPPLNASELQDIVEIPAKMAGISWEVNEKGISLSKYIVGDIPLLGELPLVEFALNRLYEKRDETNTITYQAYEEIGQLKGGALKYANNFYNGLDESNKERFSQFLGRTITASGQTPNIYTRKTACLDDLPTDEDRSFAVKLVNSHLFTSDKDFKGRPTITLAHEILISNWEVIRDWISREKDLIRQNDYYENAARHWDENGRSGKYLIKADNSLEMEYFLTSWGNMISPMTKAFLQASIKQIRRKGSFWAIVFLPFTSNLLFLSIVGWTNQALFDSTIAESGIDLDYTWWITTLGPPFFSMLFISNVFIIYNKLFVKQAKTET